MKQCLRLFVLLACWNTIDWKPGQTPKDGAGSPTGNTWCPAECDVSRVLEVQNMV